MLNGYTLLGKGELQESVLGPVLYTVFSNSLAEARLCTTIKFTESKLADWWMHSSLQVRGTWAGRRNWLPMSLMKFNKDKCRVLQNLGRQSLLLLWRLKLDWLGSSFAAKNLWLLVDSKVNVMSKQWVLAVMKANNIRAIWKNLGYMKKVESEGWQMYTPLLSTC